MKSLQKLQARLRIRERGLGALVVAQGEILNLTCQNVVRAFWWAPHFGIINFGDLLTPFLLRHYGFTPIFASPRRTKLFCTGSILHFIPRNFDGFILGAGAISGQRRYTFPRAKILGLRGKLTQELVSAPSNITLGDPGLLAVKVAGIQPRARWTLGIVPHYSDFAHEAVRQLIRRYPNEVFLIDVRQNPQQVIGEVAACQHVVSSSLHGLVVADALGLPNRWITISEGLLGGHFKFNDYYSSLNTAQTPLALHTSTSLQELISAMANPAEHIAEVQDALASRFEEMANAQ